MIIFSIVLLFLASSCTQSDDWTVAHIATGNKTYNSSKLMFSSHDTVNGLDLEFLCVQEKIHTYLQVHSQTIPPYRGNYKEAVVTLQIGETTFSDIAHRHEGGQRLLLSDALQEHLLKALIENKSVTIRLQGFKTVVTAENFADHFKAFQSSPIKNPFQLPFKL